MQSGRRKICRRQKIYWCRLFEVNNIRHFIVSNYIEESVLDRNPQLHTTKEDAENHGLGILSVKKVVNQYGGLIDISEENSRFMVHIACV